MELIIKYWPLFLEGATTTVLLSFFSVIVGVGCGTLMALARLSSNQFLSKAAKVYIDIIRGTPLLVQLYLVYFGLATVLDLNDFVSGVIAVSVNTTAYIAEIIRGGIQAVDKGQYEACMSLGLPYSKSMQKVILPQAIRIMVPSFINQFVITLKDTSILSIIGIAELTQTGKVIIARNLQSSQMWLIVGVMYLIVIVLLTKLSAHLERNLK